MHIGLQPGAMSGHLTINCFYFTLVVWLTCMTPSATAGPGGPGVFCCSEALAGGTSSAEGAVEAAGNTADQATGEKTCACLCTLVTFTRHFVISRWGKHQGLVVTCA